MIKQKFKTEYLDYNLTGCFVDSHNKFALIHIFKNASISMRNALGMRGKYYEWSEAKKIKNIETLCIIREPTNRLVSAYQYILRLEDGGFPHRHPINITKETKFFNCKKDPIKSFVLFLEFIQNNGFYDAVLVPQNQFLDSRNLKIHDIDHLFILENIQEEYDIFCKMKKIDNKLQIDNSSSRDVTKMLMEFINTDLERQKQIYDLYEKDYQMYKLWSSK